jgi:outer membrane protein assembly factor BamE (lipoprotein component of BamABCDE complex)
MLLRFNSPTMMKGLYMQKMMTALSFLSVFFLSFLFLTGCGVIHPYQPDVQQGNVVSQTMAESVRPGMSKEQVRGMLGSSVLPNLFDENHWGYVYTMQHNGGQIVRKKIDIFFQNDRVTHISKAEGKIS